MAQTNITEEILCLQSYLETLKKYLPYADGQAYYQDLREIESVEQKIRSLIAKCK